MAYRVKEAFQVKVYHIVVAFAYYLPRFLQSMVAASSGAEAIATIGELTLVYGHQYLVDGLLHQSVDHSRDSQLAHLTIVLGYLYPKDGIRTVTTVKQRTYQCILVGAKPWEQLLTRHLVNTSASLILHHSFISLVQIIGIKDCFKLLVSEKNIKVYKSVSQSQCL